MVQAKTHQRLNIVLAKYSRFMASLLLVIILTVSCIGIFQSNNEPIFDQTHISYQFQMGYPKISDGISSYLIFGTFNIFQPYDPIQTNKAIRTLATAGYLISGGLLSWTVFTKLNRRWFFIPFVILFYTSRYPYLWLSTELFAGTFIMLALWSILNSYSYLYVSIFLALFSFAKPDLILPGVLLGGYIAINYGGTRRDKVIRIVTLLGTISLFIFPGIFQSGFQYLNPGSRLLGSFGQHYGLVVYTHQISISLNPWFEWKTYLQAGFGDVDNIWMAIRSSPEKYMDFVFLTTALSLRKMGVSNLLYIIPWLVYGAFYKKLQYNKIVLILFSANLLPVILFSTLHVRYQARFYPLLLISGFTSISHSNNRKLQILFVIFLALLLLLQINQSIPIISDKYWFPD